MLFNNTAIVIYLDTNSDGSLFNLANLKVISFLRKVIVRELRYAYNNTLVSRTEDGLQQMINCFADACK